MRNKDFVNFTHYELLKLASVVRGVKAAALQQHNRAEYQLMKELLRSLATYDVDAYGCMVMLDRVSKFTLWSVMETYASYCSDTNQYIEYAHAVTIMEKLQK